MKWNRIIVKLGGTMILLYVVSHRTSSEKETTLMDIHGLGYSNDGKQILIPAHDGLEVYSEAAVMLQRGLG